MVKTAMSREVREPTLIWFPRANGNDSRVGHVTYRIVGCLVQLVVDDRCDLR